MRLGWVKDTGELAFEVDETSIGGEFASACLDRTDYRWDGLEDVDIIEGLSIEQLSDILKKVVGDQE